MKTAVLRTGEYTTRLIEQAKNAIAFLLISVEYNGKPSGGLKL
jgi:NAD(P)H-dependent FMN reductase